MSREGRCDYSLKLEDTDINLGSRYFELYEREQKEFRCHRETAQDCDYCIFHQSPEDRHQSIDIEKIFLECLTNREVDIQGVNTAEEIEFETRRQQVLRQTNFIGAKLGDLTLTYQHFPTESLAPVDLRKASLGTVELEEARIQTSLQLDSAKFESLRLRGATIDGALSAKEATCVKIELREADIRGDLTLDGITTDKKIGLRYAEIGGETMLRDTRIGTYLSLNSATIHGALQIRNLRVSKLDFSNAKLRSGFKIEGENKISGLFSIDKAAVGGKAVLRNTEISDDLVLDNSTWDNEVKLNTISVDRRVSGTNAVFRDLFQIHDGNFGMCHSQDHDSENKITFDFSGARFQTSFEFDPERVAVDNNEGCLVDLSGSTIAGGRLPQSAASGKLYYSLIEAHLGDIKLVPDETDAKLFDHYLLYLTEFDGFDFASHTHRSALNQNWRIHDFPDCYLQMLDGFPLPGDMKPVSSSFVSKAVCKFTATPNLRFETASTLETTYLRARRGADELGDTTAASKFFFREKRYIKAQQYRQFADGVASSIFGRLNGDESRRHGEQSKLHSGRKWIASVLLEATCGYGELSLRPVNFSIFAISFYTLVYLLIGALGQPPLTSLVGSQRGLVEVGYIILIQISFSIQSFVTLLFGSNPANKASLLVRILAATEGFLGAFLIALFVFAFTRSVYR